MLLDKYFIFELTTCTLVWQSRSAYRYLLLPRDDEELFRSEVIRMVSTYGRYDKRFIAGMMHNAGLGQDTTNKFVASKKRNGLNITQKQPSSVRPWLPDGSCVRLKEAALNNVWSYDFVQIRDAYGDKICLLTRIDEFSRKYLVIHCARRIGSIQVIEKLANAIITHGIPQYIRSINITEFITQELSS